MSYTKGPWSFRLNNDGTFSIFGDGGSKILICNAGLINRDPNAKLISAAPDLIDALQEVIRVFDSAPSSISDTVWCTGLSSETLYDRCVAAVEKATGKGT